MAGENNLRWCNGCCRLEVWGYGWYELWEGQDGSLVIHPISEPDDYHAHFRGNIFACGRGSSLALAERWLDTGSFEPAASTLNPEPAQPGPTANA